MIENTSQRNPIAHLLGTMSGSPSDYILGMEADGQRQLVNSDRLPTELGWDTQQEFEALGFTFGDPDPNDPMFRPATLPDGWKREGSDHSMWSYLVDGYGRRRVAIFYKAAFYDRRAHMSLIRVDAYLRTVVDNGSTPVVDDTWLTRQVALDALADLRDRALNDADEAEGWAQRGDSSCWGELAREHRSSAAKFEALRATVEAG